jgi:hypothetical protein
VRLTVTPKAAEMEDRLRTIASLHPDTAAVELFVPARVRDRPFAFAAAALGRHLPALTALDITLPEAHDTPSAHCQGQVDLSPLSTLTLLTSVRVSSLSMLPAASLAAIAGLPGLRKLVVQDYFDLKARGG